ncbi:MAG TPA: glycosyltransferase family 4 protein [Thermoanaerobaculia bacterium]
MIRVAALTSGRNVPSARFRVRQHIDPLRWWGIDVVESVPRIDAYRAIPWDPASRLGRFALRALYQGLIAGKTLSRLPGVLASRRADVTWLERGLLPGRLTLEPLLGTPLVLDVDDAIWMHGRQAERAAADTASRAAIVFAGNAFLAEWFSRYCRDVRVIPTAVDTDRFGIAGEGSRYDRFTIVWTGTSSNLPYLYAIEPALERFLAGREAELLVVSERAPRFRTIDSSRVRFVRWSPATEASAIGRAQVGVMPLGTSDWDRGKCSFKMLQYMACGLPVVATPTGMNRDLLEMDDIGFGPSSESEWVDALMALESDPDGARRLGSNGRKLVETRFSRNVVSVQIRDAFRSLR